MKFNSKFWIIVIIEGLMVCGYSLSFPFLAIYLTQNRGFNMSITGLYFSILILISSFSSILGGTLSDYLGRKKIMFYSLFVRGVFVIAITFCINYNLNPLWILFFNFMSSISGLGFHPVAMAYISDIVDEKDRIKAYSVLRVSTNAGWASGPALGGFLSNISYSLAFGVSSVVFIFASFLVLLKIREFNNNRVEVQKIMSISNFSSQFKRLLFLSFFLASVMSQLVVPLSLYSKKYLGFSEKDIGFLFTLNGLIVVFFQYFVGSKIKEESLSKTISLSCLLYASGYLLFGYSDNYYMAIISIIIVTIGEVILSPSVSSFVIKLSPSSRKGLYMGVHSMISDFGRAFGVFMGTFIIDKFSIYFREASWYFVFLISLMSSYGFLIIERKKS